MTTTTTTPPTQAQAELEAAKADPINGLIIDALTHWGANPPLEVMQQYVADTGKSLATLRARQKRLIRLMTDAGTPPEPVLHNGEAVHLRDNPSVVGCVVSLTRRNCQVRLADGSWITTPVHTVVRLFPKPETPDPFEQLSRGRRALAQHRRRQTLLKRATSTTNR